MAGPTAPSTNPSASASVAPKEMTFLPPPTLQSVEKKLAAAPPATTANAQPSEQVVVPPRGTLAAGRYEARPSTIWLVVAVGAILVLSWALARVRRARIEQRNKAEALTRLGKKPSP